MIHVKVVTIIQNNSKYYTIKINVNSVITILKEGFKIILLLFLVKIITITTSYLIWSEWLPITFNTIFIIALTTITSILILKFYPIVARIYILVPIILGLLIEKLGVYQCTILHIESTAMYEFYSQKRFSIIYTAIACAVISIIISKWYLIVLKNKGGNK